MKTVNTPHSVLQADGSQGFTSTTTKVITDEKHWFIKTEPEEMNIADLDPWKEGDNATDPFVEPWGVDSFSTAHPVHEPIDLNQNFANPLYSPGDHGANFVNPLYGTTGEISQGSNSVNSLYVLDGARQPEAAASQQTAPGHAWGEPDYMETGEWQVESPPAAVRTLKSGEEHNLPYTIEDDLAMASFRTYVDSTL